MNSVLWYNSTYKKTANIIIIIAIALLAMSSFGCERKVADSPRLQVSHFNKATADTIWEDSIVLCSIAATDAYFDIHHIELLLDRAPIYDTTCAPNTREIAMNIPIYFDNTKGLQTILHQVCNSKKLCTQAKSYIYVKPLSAPLIAFDTAYTYTDKSIHIDEKTDFMIRCTPAMRTLDSLTVFANKQQIHSQKFTRNDTVQIVNFSFSPQEKGEHILLFELRDKGRKKTQRTITLIAK